MAANSTLSLSSLDFDTLKSNFITYLQSQSAFKDYNFSGSNMNVLLDILSYNSYLNSFYLNMVASEMFMDSAQLFNSVVSHAKELNYVPRSATSSTANISFTVSTTGIQNPFIIPPGTTFSGVNSNGTFSFTTDSTTYYNSSNGIYTIDNLLIYEGNYVNDSFIIDYTQQNQQFILSNPNIDLNSLSVTVYENSTTGTIYTRAENLYNLNSNSNIYFVQASQNNQYEILFGDNVFGHKPINSSLITAQYRIASGNISDGISSFSLSYDLGRYNKGSATVNGSITTLANSNGGANQEIIESIKFNAPRYYATQNRAVTSDDYSSLILSNFGGYISDVAVYGGELLTPKQYGSVAVCLKSSISTITPDYTKSLISNFLLKYVSLPNKIILTDPDYFYCKVNTTVSFSSTTTNLTSSDIQNEVLNTIINYSNENLNSFNKDFRYSKFIAAIDNTDQSIISNDTTVIMIKRIVPELNSSYSCVINYNNTASIEDFSLHLVNLPAAADEPVFYSSTFTYVDANGIQYPNAILRDDNYGNLVIYNKINGVIVYLPSTFGTINYQTGQVQIKNLTISGYSGNYINFYLELEQTDISVSLNQILEIDPNDVSITVTPS